MIADELFNDVDWNSCTDIDPDYDSDYDIRAHQTAEPEDGPELSC